MPFDVIELNFCGINLKVSVSCIITWKKLHARLTANSPIKSCHHRHWQLISQMLAFSLQELDGNFLLFKMFRCSSLVYFPPLCSFLCSFESFASSDMLQRWTFCAWCVDDPIKGVAISTVPFSSVHLLGGWHSWIILHHLPLSSATISWAIKIGRLQLNSSSGIGRNHASHQNRQVSAKSANCNRHRRLNSTAIRRFWLIWLIGAQLHGRMEGYSEISYKER